VQKITNFLKFMEYPHGQGRERVEPVWTFFGQGEVNFPRFCTEVFHGRLLILCVNFFNTM